MGNSSSHSAHHHGSKGGRQSPQQYGHSLPRDGHGSSTAAAQKHYNGGFKVLPERVPGQKLRLTDNGSVLHNGGTLSGRKLGATGIEIHKQQQQQQQQEVDIEFLKVLRRRADSAQEVRRDDYIGGHQLNGVHGSTNVLGKKYHSDPDLLNSPGIISSNPLGQHLERPGKAKKKLMLRKSKAPQPPACDDDEEVDSGRRSAINMAQQKGRKSPSKDNGRRGFASFLKPSSSHHKKNGAPLVDDARPRLSTVEASARRDVIGAERFTPSLPVLPQSQPLPPATGINAEVTSAKMDLKDKSITYVLERRHQDSNAGSMLGGASGLSTDAVERCYIKRTQSPEDGGIGQSSHGLYGQKHGPLQGKLSDGGLQARSIDRADIRNGRLAELQKRVRSMDSLANAEDQPIFMSSQQRSPRYDSSHAQEVFKSMDSVQPAFKNKLPSDKHDPLGRRMSSSSSHLSDGQMAVNPWEKFNLRPKFVEKDSGREDLTRVPLPFLHGKHSGPGGGCATPTRDILMNVDCNSPKSYFYGGRKDAVQNSSPKMDFFLRSLSRKCIADAVIHPRSFSDLAVGPYDRKSGLVPKDASVEQDRRHREEHHQDLGSGFEHLPPGSRHLGDIPAKEKLRPVNSKGLPLDHHNLSSGGRIDSKEHKDMTLCPPLLNDSRLERNEGSRGHRYPHEELNDNMSNEDEMDISMQLRPTLPKRLLSLPRFSPTQVWRSFSLDEAMAAINCDSRSDVHSSDGEEGDVFEDRIHRIAKPIAPPRSNNEKSADSGISPGANSPVPLLYDFDMVTITDKHGSLEHLPTKHQSLSPSAALLHRQQQQQHSGQLPPPISPLTTKDVATRDMGGRRSPRTHRDKGISSVEDRKPTWTPEEDLASDFDTGSGEQLVPHHSWTAPGTEMVSSQPKLTSRKEMFFLRRSLEQETKDSPSEAAGKDATAGGSGSGSSNIGDPSSGRKSKNGSDPSPPPLKYNSVRKLKRSLSGVLQGNGRQRSSEEAQKNLDENWSLSRSLPNSLHNGLEGELREANASTDVNQFNEIKDLGPTEREHSFSQRLPRSESGPVFPFSSRPANVERQIFTDLEGHVYNNNKLAATRRAMMMSLHDDSSGPVWDGPASGIPYNRGNGHIVYLPKYEAMEIVPICGEDTRRRAYSDLGTGSKMATEGFDHLAGSSISVGYNGSNLSDRNGGGASRFGFRKPKKFSYQSTVRQLERKQLEQKLSEVVAVKEKQRSREMELVNKVEEEFQRKRDREKATIRQQLRILSLESRDGRSDTQTNGYHENSRSLPRDHPAYDAAAAASTGTEQNRTRGLGGELFTDSERMHLSLPPMVIPPEDYDMTIGRGVSAMGDLYGIYPHGSLPPNGNTKRPTPELPRGSNGGGGGPRGNSSFFSGIGKWMRRQQRMEKSEPEWSPSRQEPDGAPSSMNSSYGNGLSDGHANNDRNGHPYLPSMPPSVLPYQQTRSQVVSGAKFSSGRLPDGQLVNASDPSSFMMGPSSLGAPSQQSASGYSSMLQKQQQQGKGPSTGHGEARTAVWISSDRTPLLSPSSRVEASRVNSNYGDTAGSGFYDVPYDSYSRALNAASGAGPGGAYWSSEGPLSGPQPMSLQRDWSAGQRHSIAVDFSGRDKWAPASYHIAGRRPASRETTAGVSTSGQMLRCGQGGGVHAVVDRDSSDWRNSATVEQANFYRQPVSDGNSLDYRRRYAADYNHTPSMGAHQRSLSCNQIWDDSSDNNGKLDELNNPRTVVSPVQPFSPKKMYRPVVFPSVPARGAVD